MIRYRTGNLIDAEAKALVNTVNTVGVMGKGIALMFKEAFPDNFRAYEAACGRGEVEVGRMFVTHRDDLYGPEWIINFPTKKHWRQPSQLGWIVDGLEDLRRVIAERGIRSLALPPLGAGNGGLEWRTVRSKIEESLADLEGVDVLVFEPTPRYQNVAKRAGVETLTPARALIGEMIRRYWVLGFECTLLEAQKLAWLVQRIAADMGLPDPFRLKFRADRYGPYADGLRHLLDGLDGSYLHCERRIADAGPLDVIWFEEARRERLDAYLTSPEAKPYKPVLEAAGRLIEGFESPYGMELLATVDWLRRHGVGPTLEALADGLRAWPGGRAAADRKLRIFDRRSLGLALARLEEVGAG